MSVSQFCKEYGLAKGSLYRAIKRRRLPVVRTGEKGMGIKVDPARMLAAMAEPAGTAETAAR